MKGEEEVNGNDPIDPIDPLASGDSRTAERDGEEVRGRLGDGEMEGGFLAAMLASGPHQPLFMTTRGTVRSKTGNCQVVRTRGQVRIGLTVVESEKKKKWCGISKGYYTRCSKGAVPHDSVTRRLVRSCCDRMAGPGLQLRRVSRRL